MRIPGHPCLAAVPLLLILCAVVNAQGPTPPLISGPNVNMVMTSPSAAGGVDLSGKLEPPVTACQGLKDCNDTALLMQNEPSMDVSPRNPRVIVAGANDWRLLAGQVPTPEPGAGPGSAVWCGFYKSFDGGQTWRHTLLPGFPGDTSQQGLASPLRSLPAVACGDPSIRFGPNGLLHYTAVGFNTGNNALSNLVQFRFLHNNNRENGDTIKYLDAVEIDRGTAGTVIDSPYTAQGLPFLGAPTCNVDGQPFPSGTTYVAYTAFTGSDPNAPGTNDTGVGWVARSTDCGRTYSKNRPFQTLPLVNFTAVAIAPRGSGQGVDTVYVVARVFQTKSNGPKHSFVISKSTDGGKSWGKPVTIAEFANTDDLFIQPAQLPGGQVTNLQACLHCARTNPRPAITVDANGTVYVAFSMRLGPQGSTGLSAAKRLRDARIVVAWSKDGVTWPRATSLSGISLQAGTTVPTTAVLVESVLDPTTYLTSYNTQGRSQQIMPVLGHIAGKVVVGFQDSRNSGTRLLGNGTRVPLEDSSHGKPADPAANRFNNFISDFYVDSAGAIQKLNWRQTVEIRIAFADPANRTANTFGPFSSTVLGSQFRSGAPGLATTANPTRQVIQAEFDCATCDTHGDGTKPFRGDYFDFGYQRIVMDPGASPRFNNSSDNLRGLFTFADNRNWRPPTDGHPENFTPVGQSGCVVGQTGMRNQDIFEFGFDQGLVAEFAFNSKPLSSTTPRAFSLLVRNTTPVCRSFSLTIAGVSSGTVAVFSNGAGTLEVTVPPRSTIARTVSATSSSDIHGWVKVNVAEITRAGCTSTSLGLHASAVLNPDATVPDLLDPFPGSNINTAESYNPNVGFPIISEPTQASNPNTAILNPAINDPDMTEPFITDPDMTDPDMTDPDMTTPGTDPDMTDPDMTDPDMTQPDFGTGTLRDTTFPASLDGNTTSSLAARQFLTDALSACTAGCTALGNCATNCKKLQITLRRVTKSLVANGCQLRALGQNVVVANISSALIAGSSTALVTDPSKLTVGPTDPDMTDPDMTNPTMTLAPSDTTFDPTDVTSGSGRITIRSVTPNPDTTVMALRADEGETPVNFSAPIPPGLTRALRAVLRAQAVNTGVLTDLTGKPPLTLTIGSTNLNNPPPTGVVAVPFNPPDGYTLQPFGGTSPYTWSLVASSTECLSSSSALTNGLSLSSAGVVTGPSPLSGPAGLRCLDIRIQDSKGHSNTEVVNFQVNEVKITAVNACLAGTGPGTALPTCVTDLKNNDLVTVWVKVLNSGVGDVNNIGFDSTKPLIVTVVSGTPTAPCSALPVPPASANFFGNQTKDFVYNCGPVTPSGTLKFTANVGVTVATGFFVTDTKDSNNVVVANPR